MKETYNALMGLYTKDRYDMIFKVKNKEITMDDFKDDVRQFCKRYYPNEENVEGTIDMLVENLFGYSILTPLIKDPNISDIKVHAWDRIIVKERGEKYVSDVKFNSEEQYNRFIQAVITRNQINASNVNAIQRFTDDDTSDDFILRFTLATPYLTTGKNYELIIRKVEKDFASMDELIDRGVMTEDVKNYIISRWNEGSILVCGANSSGKTTLLNALKEEIPYNKSVLVIQQAEELTTKNHPDMIFLHTLEGATESETTYDLKDLSIAGLTMDIEFFIIGEVKGAEASYLLNASYTGHTCGATIHASGSESAIDKLVDYALYTSSYSKQELTAMMTGFKTVIFMKDYKVCEISEITGLDRKTGKLKYKPVFRQYLQKKIV